MRSSGSGGGVIVRRRRGLRRWWSCSGREEVATPSIGHGWLGRLVLIGKETRHGWKYRLWALRVLEMVKSWRRSRVCGNLDWLLIEDGDFGGSNLRGEFGLCEVDGAE
ncbi:hypothetical protein M0R45_031007 [Rubus argutus]|uniref:Uncharacterized protein n=1 Tax=Rubus argutus TaxID=59490 RepID=A0AAW1WD07_RUBAR